MNKEDFKPYILERIHYLHDESAILDVFPIYTAEEDKYYEIYVEAVKDTLQNFERAVGRHIFVDLLSSDTLEILEGEFYSESSTDGQRSYRSFEFKSFEKTAPEWKPKYNSLLQEFRSLFGQKLIVFAAVRQKLVSRYKNIYLTETFAIPSAILDQTGIFENLFHMFDSNPAWDGLNLLLNPNSYGEPSHKDWQISYSKLNETYKILQETDVGVYETIRDFMIQRYRKAFLLQLSKVKYNHSNVDEQRLVTIFENLMTELGNTSDDEKNS
ncbi:MAG: hypothetical protein EOO88_39560 [Pedobacter sp.]|nr:MAG: hypothetical protein EOO88_39560 [Pedobacter sp.]